MKIFRYTLDRLIFLGGWCLILLALYMFWRVIFCSAARADLPEIYVPFRWTVNTARPARQEISITRGETLALEPQYTSYDGPVDLSGCWEVLLRYRSADMAAGTYYPAYGEVTDAANGKVRIIWAPSNETAAATYTFDIKLSGVTDASLRAAGTIRLLGDPVMTVTNVPNVVTGKFDWASVEHLNIADAPFLSDVELSVLQGQVSALQSGKVDVAVWQSTNSLIFAMIADAAAMAEMNGDVTGPSTNNQVVAIRSVPVGVLSPGAGQDGYGLKYDHATGNLILGPVATEGTSISNLLTLTSTATATDVPSGAIGLYRIIRPGNLPSAVINVNGAEIAWLDLQGITMRSGSLNLLNTSLAVNIQAYDGTAANPAYGYAAWPGIGRYRFSVPSGSAEGFSAGSNLVYYVDADGIHLTNGAALFGYIEADPLAVQASTTYAAWTNAGGTYTTNDSIIATSPLLTNGYAAIAYDADGAYQVITQISTDGTNWIAGTETNTAVYCRLSTGGGAPPPGEASLAISNIVVTSWTRPDLWSQSADTAGQQLLVDNISAVSPPRQAANRAYVDAQTAAINPSSWSSYPAAQSVRLEGQRLLPGDGWNMYVDLANTTNGLCIANNGSKVLTFEPGLSGLYITNFVLNSSTATVFVATNNVNSTPMIQWTADLLAPDWIMLEPAFESYPGSTNGAYVVDVALPAGDTGYLRAVQASGAARIDAHAPFYETGHRLAARPYSSATNNPTLWTPLHVGHQLYITGATNIIYSAFGATTNDWRRTWPVE